MRDILDPRFAAQKLAASTLEALRMSAYRLSTNPRRQQSS